MQRYASTLLIALLASIFGFAGFNALIDPFSVTGAPDIPGLTARDTRQLDDGGRVHVGDRIMRGVDQSVLLGSSRTVDGFPADPQGWPGGLYNAGMRGTNIYELVQAMTLAARNPELRCVVIGLDLDELGTHSKAKATYWLSALTDGHRELALARVALSPSTALASVRLISDNLSGSAPRVPWADSYEPGAQRERYESGVRGLYRFYLGYTFDPDRLAYLERAVDSLTANGVQVVGFIHPLHGWREETMFRAEREADYFALRRDLAGLFDRYSARTPSDACIDGGASVLWDFSGFQEFAILPAPASDQTDAHPAFYEPSHYLPHIGQAMLDRIRGEAGEGIFAPAGFGERLTLDMAGTSEAAIRRRRDAWLATPDGAAATLLLDGIVAGDPGPAIETPQYLNRDDWLTLDRNIERIASARSER